jgi:hypothetical protein
MGIPPYMTPQERARTQAEIDHYHKFLEERQYKNCYKINPDNPGHYLPREGFPAPNGNTYRTAEEYSKALGWWPGLEKDGVVYGYYWPHRHAGYVDPWQDQVNFLTRKGYKRLNFKLSEDYLDNNRLLEEHYHKTGDIPRWEKAGEQIGHIAALTKEGYKYDYPGLPELKI